MICIHHNKDLDGFSSGAIVKLKYPEAKLIGWDYKDPIPDFAQFVGEDVIMIDISFPVKDILELARISRLTVIDHHVSFFNDVHNQIIGNLPFIYIYKEGFAACEIGWGYLFPDKPVSYAVTLLGRYDTWRQKEGDWEEETLPFQYAMRLECTSAQTFNPWLFENDKFSQDIVKRISLGKNILKYQQEQDRLACERSSFEKEVFGGLRAICLNTRAFSSNTLKTVYNPENHDIMIGFEYTGDKWSVSLRSIKEEIDVSLIAKSKGGGGHKKAAGFESKTFEGIFI